MSTVEFKLKANSKVGFVDNIDIVAAKKTIEKLLQSDLVSFEIEELPTLPEVKKVETGVLKSYTEITGHKKDGKYIYELGRSTNTDGCGWFIDNGERNLLVGKRIVIAEHNFPREFYRDIETTWDFNSIQVGSLVEIKDFYENVSWGKFAGNGVDAGKDHWIGNNHIKSIRIIEIGESK